MYITLAFNSTLKELVSQERIVVLQQLQELNKGEEGFGSVIEPFTNPNLFLELKAKNTNLAQLIYFYALVRG